MSDRDELAALIAAHVDVSVEHGDHVVRDEGALADAILARWRLVPVEVDDSAPPPAEKFNAITDWREPVPGWSFTTGKTLGSAIIERWYDYPEGS